MTSLFRFIDSFSLTPYLFGALPSSLDLDLRIRMQYFTDRGNIFSYARQADLLLLSGPISYAQIPLLKRIYNSMLGPQWTIYLRNNIYHAPSYQSYSLVQHIDNIIPIDVEIAGHPLSDEAMNEALKLLKDNILRKSFGRRKRMLSR